MTNAMIRVQGDQARVEITGHAGDALVCAGISAISCAVLNALGGRARNVVCESGEVCFDALVDTDQARGALDVLIFGLIALSEKFPDRAGVTLDAGGLLK